MTYRKLFLQKFLLFCALFTHSVVWADEISDEQHQSVVARKIGHEVLLMTGDSTSLVLPITKIDGRYIVRFGTDFEFEPTLLNTTVKRVVEDARLSRSYLVEVIMCEEQTVVYSFEGGGFQRDSLDLMPCATRAYPYTCYELAITFGKTNAEQLGIVVTQKSNPPKEKSAVHLWWIVVSILVVLGIVLIFRRKKRTVLTEDHIIHIGAYIFDKRNMHLTFKGETVELTSKEADLLFLLHSSANQTIERDTILRIVWGDDGDYVGRTLDVFISKLRKKLAGDPAIKIANIRGVGYRLVVDVPSA